MIVIKTNLSEIPKSCKECKLKSEIRYNSNSSFYCSNGEEVTYSVDNNDKHYECPLAETEYIIDICTKCNGSGECQQIDYNSQDENKTIHTAYYHSSTTNTLNFKSIICNKCNGTGKVKIMDKNGCVE